jgi:hypothetical protein
MLPASRCCLPLLLIRQRRLNEAQRNRRGQKRRSKKASQGSLFKREERAEAAAVSEGATETTETLTETEVQEGEEEDEKAAVEGEGETIREIRLLKMRLRF